MRPLRIGLVYETFETYPRQKADPIDVHVEFEPESTIEALEGAIRHLGHRATRVGSPHDLLERIGRKGARGGRSVSLDFDAVFNLAEGLGGRNREAWAPVLLEMAGVPTIGSDALSLSLSLDKAWTNRWLAAVGIPVAAQTTIARAGDVAKLDLPAAFPLFVKPRWEGTAKGIRATSRVASRAELEVEVARVVADYAQPALVEAFVPGPEYTVTLVGNDPPRALPVLQRALERESGIGIHALPDDPRLEPITTGVLDASLESRLAALARRAFEALECRDFARVDFRLDAAGEPVFLEINPLPTFATDGSFAILAELEGIGLEEMLGRCILAGLDRLGLTEAASSGRGEARGTGRTTAK